MSTREFFTATWPQEAKTFVKVVRALPADQADWRPHPRSRSAAELVWLLAQETGALVELLDTGVIDWHELPPTGTLADMTAAYERHLGEVSSRLQHLDDATWDRPAKMLFEGQEVLAQPLGEMLWFFLFDAIHHRGQLSVYIRPMGGKVPAIYGPSADDPGGG